MRCDQCKFWTDPQSGHEATMATTQQCRRHAPSPAILDDTVIGINFQSLWPWTMAGDWCGEFQEKEASIKLDRGGMEETQSRNTRRHC